MLVLIVRRSREGAWIEIIQQIQRRKRAHGRSREGAWIEIVIYAAVWALISVAPVRERGLKLLPISWQPNPISRSREGAWIEITAYNAQLSNVASLP